MITRKDINESKRLDRELKRCEAIDHTEEIEEIEETLWALHGQREKESFLFHAVKAEEIKVQMDILRAKLVNMGNQIEATDALIELKKFNRPHLKILKARLIKNYEDLERLKFCTLQESHDTRFFGRMLRGETNCKAILVEQLKISELHEEMLSKVCSLDVYLEKIKKIESDPNRTYPITKLKLHESERYAMESFIIPKEDLDQENYRITIVSPSLIKQRIRVIDSLAKTRQLQAA